MKKILISFLILISLQSRAQSSLDKKVEEIAQSYMRTDHTVGLSVGVLKDGKTYFYGYGETVKGNGKKPDARTIFEIGSITKTFTATLLAMAVGEGKVRLDDPVNKYLPDSIPLLQYNNRVVTLRDLSNHTSALPRLPANFNGYFVNYGDPYRSYSVDNLYSFLKHFQLNRQPGTQYEYSNTAVGLLGMILQHVYGMSYEELILKYICRPLGLDDTRVLLRKEDSATFSKGYNELGYYNGPWNLPAAFAGAGAIRSTARDMLKYAQANLNGPRGSLGRAIALTHDTTFSNNGVTLGLGWHFGPPGGEKIWWHNGATGGYRCYLGIDPGKRFAVIVLSNVSISTDTMGVELMKWLASQ